MRGWPTNTPKGRHRSHNRVTVRSEVLYALLIGSLLGGIFVLAVLGYVVTLRSGIG